MTSPENLLFLDAESLLRAPELRTDELKLANVIHRAVQFSQLQRYRTVIFAASGMPDSLTRHEKGDVLRLPRTEFRAWRRLVQELGCATMRFGDYGVVDPGQIGSNVPIIPPSRVRETTEDEYVLHKGKRDDIRSLARAAFEDGMLPQQVESWGLYALLECATGYGSPGGPTQWISRDTNRHIENTIAAMGRYLSAEGDSAALSGDEVRGPWLQESLSLIGRDRTKDDETE